MNIKNQSHHSFLATLHPVLISTLFFILGISVAALTFSFFKAGILALTALLIAYKLKNTWLARATYLLFFMLMPLALGSWRYTQVIQNYKSIKNNILDKSVDCVGWINAIDTVAESRFKHSLTIMLTEVTLPDTRKIQVPYTLKIYTLDAPALEVGDTIALKDVRIKSGKPKFEQYLLKEFSVGSLFLKKLEYTRLSSTPNSFTCKIAQLKRRVTRSLEHKINKLTNTLFCTIFLGTKPSNTLYLEAIKQTFSYWGIVHYLARSGLHVALIIMIWAFLLRWIPLPYFVKQFMLMCLILLYNVLSWSSISFLRAFITFLLYKFCVMHNRPSHTVHIFTLTTLAVLITNPVQLFFLDFQLSFALTFALAWFNEVQLYFKRVQPHSA